MTYEQACAVVEEYVVLCRQAGATESVAKATHGVLYYLLFHLDARDRLAGFPTGLTMDDIDDYLIHQDFGAGEAAWLRPFQRSILEAFLWWALEQPVKKPA